MRARIRTLIGAAALAAALAACDAEEPSQEPGSGVTVVLSRDAVSPGDTIRARVRNNSTEQVTYGLDYRLQREVDGEFIEVELPDRVVIQIALIANPGATGPPVTVEVPTDAEPGRWRVILGNDPDLAAEFDVVS